MAKKAVVSVISDLVTDQRVHRTALTLAQEGWEVLLVGRMLPGSLRLDHRPYPVKRFKLWFHKGPLFYLNYNVRLFFFLLFSRTGLLVSNDLDTLPANFVIGRLRSIPVIYDSHEYFTGVPELEGRPVVRKIWKGIERFILPRLKHVITVNESIAGMYKKEYGINVSVLRNIPASKIQFTLAKDELRRQLGLPLNKFIYILQGSGINVHRGAEEAVEAMKYLNDALLIIAGSGDVIDELKKMMNALSLNDKIVFTGKMPYEELMKYTFASDAGLTLDKGTNLNYRYSLPNKLFDYIYAGIPVLASDLPEVRKVVEGYNVGMITSSHEPDQLAAAMKSMQQDLLRLEEWRKNEAIAAGELTWSNEKKVLTDLLHTLG